MMNMVNQCSGVLFPLITFPYISRILQPEGLGKVNFAQAIVGIFIMIGSVGIPLYGTREAAKVRDDKQKLSQLIAELFTINSFMTLIAFLAFFIYLVSSDIAVADPLLFVYCAIPMLLAPIGFEYMFGGLEEFTFITIRTLIFRVITLIAYFWLIKGPSDYLIYALITALSVGGPNIVNLIFTKSFLYRKYFKIQLHSIKKHIKPIFLMSLTGIAYTVFSATDKVMLGYMSSSIELGYYVVSQKIVMVAVGLIVSIVSVLTPRSSYHIELGNFNEHYELTLQSFSLILSLAVICLGGMLICAENVVLLVSGREFLNATPMLMISAGSMLAITFYHFLLYQVAYPMGYDTIVCASLGLGTLCNMILNYFLIPSMHGIGASLATLLSQVMIGIITGVLLHRVKPQLIKKISIYFLKITAITLALISVICFANLTEDYIPFHNVFGYFVLYTILYLLILKMSGDVGLSIITNKIMNAVSRRKIQ